MTPPCERCDRAECDVPAARANLDVFKNGRPAEPGYADAIARNRKAHDDCAARPAVNWRDVALSLRARIGEVERERDKEAAISVAFDAGLDAAEKGTPSHLNPHPFAGDFYRLASAWAAGWHLFTYKAEMIKARSERDSALSRLAAIAAVVEREEAAAKRAPSGPDGRWVVYFDGPTLRKMVKGE